jgi:hypothetical protein
VPYFLLNFTEVKPNPDKPELKIDDLIKSHISPPLAACDELPSTYSVPELVEGSQVGGD